MNQPKVALVHDYLIQYGGAEKTLEAICEIFPDAPIYTGIYDPKLMSDIINSKDIRTSSNSIFKMFPKHLTFLMPLVFEGFDLREFDLIISDGTAWPKGILTKPDQIHISYIHTPPRFLYGYSVESTKRNAWYFKPFVRVIDHFIRTWDYLAAQRPDFLLTNSQETRNRIRKFYRRDAVVINPPVDINYRSSDLQTGVEKYFLALGRLAAYKNFDALIRAINLTEYRLVLAGTGPEIDRLKMLAGKNVEILGKVTQEKKHELLDNADGLINPVKDEDFGIVPIEAMAHGIPVLAYKAGGHLETVREGVTGSLFDSLEPEKLAESIRLFKNDIDNHKYDNATLKSESLKYSKERFINEFRNFVFDKWNARTT